MCCIFSACGRVEAPDGSEPLDRAPGDGSQDAVLSIAHRTLLENLTAASDAGPTAVIDASSGTAADSADSEAPASDARTSDAPASDAPASDAPASDALGEEIVGDARISHWEALDAGP